jgi:hypothetical protein
MSSIFPKPFQALLALYFVASLAHFAHNAEFIAFYPNMPRWLTREHVYVAWLVVSGVGVAALVMARLRWPVTAALLAAAYGALGIDGLAHYTLALCSEHTLATNLTIAFEVVTGIALLLAGAVLAWRSLAQRGRACDAAGFGGHRA